MVFMTNVFLVLSVVQTIIIVFMANVLYGLEYGLRGFHVKRVLSIEYGTNYIVFISGKRLVVSY